MRKAIILIEQCLANQDPVLDLGNFGVDDLDLDLNTPLGMTLAKCTHLTKLILSNEVYQWNLQETTVFLLLI
jgi:hypothetical protein